MRLYAIFFKGIPLINDNVTERLQINLLTGFAIYELKPGQIRPLYLEPRLACISNLLNKKSITTGYVWQSQLHTKQQINAWRTIGPPSMRLVGPAENLPPTVRRISKTLPYTASPLAIAKQTYVAKRPYK